MVSLPFLVSLASLFSSSFPRPPSFFLRSSSFPPPPSLSSFLRENLEEEDEDEEEGVFLALRSLPRSLEVEDPRFTEGGEAGRKKPGEVGRG